MTLPPEMSTRFPEKSTLSPEKMNFLFYDVGNLSLSRKEIEMLEGEEKTILTSAPIDLVYMKGKGSIQNTTGPKLLNPSSGYHGMRSADAQRNIWWA